MAHLIYSVLPMPPRKIVYIHPNESVKKCIDLMVDMDIGAVVVVDSENKLIGIVSERDIVRSCLHQCVDLNAGKVSDVVFTKVSILSPHDTVEKAMQVITQTKRRHLLIRENDEFLAILSIGDLLLHLLDDKARVIEHLEHYIHN
ncbi:CBS domain-containing protein [Legionella bononiensis]|uniref:CBS domain-containing protein n=1 Tax=Legionella bononiensis TaxID=2793102 RepID=A0ABS1W7U4_9GAMM|nr:CBS domain-containing protein [Legionella bononiensis]MBL7480049.1 CBS domain-containing protein [Legionella bononiensis]MBL7525437.1 CBS domain-containing protein [Legionella bononiensis]MBL7561620.1 CBS domain-containing protein [Legionella bononiensis]